MWYVTRAELPRKILQCDVQANQIAGLAHDLQPAYHATYVRLGRDFLNSYANLTTEPQSFKFRRV